jgi:hypothetical protein
MEEYEFKSYWSSMETPPGNATRCLVTDGELVVIATYINDCEKNSAWIFQGLTDGGTTFQVIAWMNLPRPIQKPVLVEEVVVNEKPISKCGAES